jgi:hypothetical protein
MVTLGMEILFLTFGIFIAAALGGSTEWTMAWYLVTMGVSFFMGASSAARLCDVENRDICAMHGIATWGLATLSTALLGMVVATVALFYFKPSIAAIGWGPLLQWGGIVWGGVMLSLITALGGARVRPAVPQAAMQPESPASSLRRAS